MGVAERRARHRTSLRREILEAASQLVVEEGYDRVTMRRIAERIEYSPTTIYLHFKDRTELLNAVCEETFSELGARLERLKTTPMAPLAFLREGLKLYIDFGVAHPHHYAITLLQTPRDSESTSGDQSLGRRAFDALRQAVRACVENGDIQTPSVDMTAQSLWAASHGLTALFITAKGFPFAPHAALVEHTIDALIAGLRTPPPPGRTPVVRSVRTSTFTD